MIKGLGFRIGSYRGYIRSYIRVMEKKNGNYCLGFRINKPPPCQGLSIRIPILIPIKGMGFINHRGYITTPKPQVPTSLRLSRQN